MSIQLIKRDESSPIEPMEVKDRNPMVGRVAVYEAPKVVPKAWVKRNRIPEEVVRMRDAKRDARVPSLIERQGYIEKQKRAIRIHY